mgnify:FL=1
MERREMGENRDGRFYKGCLRYKQEHEEPGQVLASKEGEQHDEVATCCDCEEKETCEKDCCGEYCCRKSN